MREFLHIIRDSPVYPVIYDQKGVVLSLPPIINGDHSKLSLNTKNIFIESTATDITRARATLQVLVAMFSEYCKEPFEIEVIYKLITINNQITNNRKLKLFMKKIKQQKLLLI